MLPLLFGLSENFCFELYQCLMVDKKIRKSLRDKNFIRRNYILGKLVWKGKEEKTPLFVTIEDWHKFIDMSTTIKFEISSKLSLTFCFR